MDGKKVVNLLWNYEGTENEAEVRSRSNSRSISRNRTRKLLSLTLIIDQAGLKQRPQAGMSAAEGQILNQ